MGSARGVWSLVRGDGRVVCVEGGGSTGEYVCRVRGGGREVEKGWCVERGRWRIE